MKKSHDNAPSTLFDHIVKYMFVIFPFHSVFLLCKNFIFYFVIHSVKLCLCFVNKCFFFVNHIVKHLLRASSKRFC